MFANCKSDNTTVKSGFEWGGDWTSCKDFQHFELIE